MKHHTVSDNKCTQDHVCHGDQQCSRKTVGNHAAKATIDIALQPASVRQELAYLGDANSFPLAVWSGMPLNPRLGHKLLLGIRADEDAFVSLFTVSASGKTARLMENRRFLAGRTQDFPSASSRVDFQLRAPAGVESFVAVASRQPLPVLLPGDVMRGGDLAPLRLNSAQLADRIHSATAGMPSGSWNVAVVDIQTNP